MSALPRPLPSSKQAPTVASPANPTVVESSPSPATTQPVLPTLDKLLRAAVDKKGSDIHFKGNSAPKIRINGTLRKLSGPPLPAEWVTQQVLSSMSEEQQKKFHQDNEMDYSYLITRDNGEENRFRMNAYYARGEVGLVARVINSQPIPLGDLHMPDVVKDLTQELNGLVLVTGATGSGKTTTLAGMIQEINETRRVKIITLEDPIEFIYEEQKADIVQRELYTDIKNWNNGLRASLRQDPDVILVGEIRDLDTLKSALYASETGHLVFATLHTNSASETLDRILDFYPHEEQPQVRSVLSANLRGILAQRLVNTIDGGRRAALEILLGKGRIPKAIREPGAYDINNVISESRSSGMGTFEDSLLELVQNNIITEETALGASTRRHNLKVALDALKEI